MVVVLVDLLVYMAVFDSFDSHLLLPGTIVPSLQAPTEYIINMYSYVCSIHYDPTLAEVRQTAGSGCNIDRVTD